MTATTTDFEHQVRAGWRLILRSRLVVWDGKKFKGVPERHFEDTHEHEYHRYESWVLFSVGTELLLKGACAIAGTFAPSSKAYFGNPPMKSDGVAFEQWLNSFDSGTAAKALAVPEYGTLKALIDGNSGPLALLCEAQPSLSPTRKREVMAAFRFLWLSIRNRDIHGYVFDRRDKEFRLVKDLFLEPINLLIKRSRVRLPTSAPEG